jgi:hypothetical protein
MHEERKQEPEGIALDGRRGGNFRRVSRVGACEE